MSEDKPTDSADQASTAPAAASASAEASAPPPAADTVDDAEARQWAMIAHLSALVGFIIPFGNIIGPLVVWQIKKDMPFVEEQGKEALNFQITVSLAAIVCFILMFILIGALLLPILGIAAIVFTIIAAIKANGGEHYEYPLTLRLVS